MPAIPWDRRESSNFGNVWVSIATFALCDVHAVFRRFNAQVDTGASVTLLRRSTAEILGIDIHSGRRIRLGSVGGGATIAYVHHLTMRFDDIAPLNAPVAIAETNDVPHLLGFLGVMERLSIQLDPLRRETRILEPTP